jgi:excisionase family DNA binding protein
MTATASKHLTMQELAEEFGCSVSTIHRLKANGKLPYIQPGGKGCTVRFPADCLDVPPVAESEATNGEMQRDQPIPGPQAKWRRPR